ncbi:hypothetical protein EV13_2045 [Prochlorococcus sp. MIT 0702]|nr:hypothetical protein EV13_2045 [Prochlorococcus sp. MIT 0702]KGG28203.1 hypothetical protein EV12_0953 [Prochlorococcus sp. MIT 0701]KGG37254.1 hypothetical protein EV14_0046 [Prochlorococcus sp. MIT 0703]
MTGVEGTGVNDDREGFTGRWEPDSVNVINKAIALINTGRKVKTEKRPPSNRAMPTTSASS